MQQQLARWDGKSAADLEKLYHRFHQQPDFVNQLIHWLDDPDLQTGASWLLKYYCDQHGAPVFEQVAGICARLAALQHWQAKLHLLQCFDHFDFTAIEIEGVVTFVRRCIEDHNKFVRAWAYNGFHRLSLQHPRYRDECEQFFEMAMRDEAASVKARIRNILKQRDRVVSKASKA